MHHQTPDMGLIQLVSDQLVDTVSPIDVGCGTLLVAVLEQGKRGPFTMPLPPALALTALTSLALPLSESIPVGHCLLVTILRIIGNDVIALLLRICDLIGR